jgi:hypothetical protein
MTAASVLFHRAFLPVSLHHFTFTTGHTAASLRFNPITPAIMQIIHDTLTASNSSPKNEIPITDTMAVPSADHTAYAMLTSNFWRDVPNHTKLCSIALCNVCHVDRRETGVSASHLSSSISFSFCSPSIRTKLYQLRAGGIFTYLTIYMTMAAASLGDDFSLVAIANIVVAPISKTIATNSAIQQRNLVAPI